MTMSRKDEMMAFAHALHRLQSDCTGRVLLLLGEAGIGKTQVRDGCALSRLPGAL
jgi:tRNA A37 threonylcarbamoyladenosine biosynthesis protein TsaE